MCIVSIAVLFLSIKNSKDECVADISVSLVDDSGTIGTELKKYLLNELSPVITCDHLLCPSCHLNA